MIMKFQIVYLALCSLAQATYFRRTATVDHIWAPTAFRPGVTLQRIWPHKLVQVPSNRSPYVIYRSSPHRSVTKQQPTNRKVFSGNPWKTTPRLPQLTSEYDFIRAASPPGVIHTDGGAIHTIPAPNLSLSQKPIVVMETSERPMQKNSADAESPKPVYEVTEKYPDVPNYKIGMPMGFSKETSPTSPELEDLLRNGAALQLASEFGLSAVAVPQQSISISRPPQQFSGQSINGLPTQQDFLQAGADGIIIQPSSMYQSDPNFLHKLQNQLLQQFPAVEFIPYTAEVQRHPQIQHVPLRPDVHLQPPFLQTHIQTQPNLFLMQNPITKRPPATFVPSEDTKSVVQRETYETTVVTLRPEEILVNNVTKTKIDMTTTPEPQNVTVELEAAESEPVTATVKYVIESNTDDQKTTPTYFAQVGHSVGNIVASGFYSALNEVRGAAAMAQVEKPQEMTKKRLEDTNTTTTTTTTKSEVKTYILEHNDNGTNKTIEELKPLLGIPFSKSSDSVKLAYTLVRAEDKDPKMTKDGAIYAGQIVEASISEDKDFNPEKASILSKRAPLRLIAVTEKDVQNMMEKEEEGAIATSTSKIKVVKAKIPPESKLTFDDITGEPVLRIYANYVDNPLQKEIITAKLKHMKDEIIKKQESAESWKSATVHSIDKTQGADSNQVTHFGLKLKARSDDYPPIFEDFED